MVFTAVGTAVLTGLSVSQRTGTAIEQSAMAEEFARSQMEYIASQAYQEPPFAYPLNPALIMPAGYSMTANAVEEVPADKNIQRIAVTVNIDGSEVLTLETFRTKPN